MDVFQPAMRHIADVVRKRPVLRLDFEQAVFEFLVREIKIVLRIHHANAVYNEAIRIHVGFGRSESSGPDAVVATFHFVSAGKLHVDHHDFCRIVLVAECDGSVVVDAWLRKNGGRGHQHNN